MNTSEPLLSLSQREYDERLSVWSQVHIPKGPNGNSSMAVLWLLFNIHVPQHGATNDIQLVLPIFAFNLKYHWSIFKLDFLTNTLPETNIAHENLIFPGKYHQNGGFSMAMLVYRSVCAHPNSPVSFMFPSLICRSAPLVKSISMILISPVAAA